MTKFADYDHLMTEAGKQFPGSKIEVYYDGETIYLWVDNRRFVFEAGSDDDYYFFVAENGDSITISLMPEG